MPEPPSIARETQTKRPEPAESLQNAVSERRSVAGILPEHFVDHVQPLGSGYAPKKAHHNVAERLGHRDLGRVIGRGRSEDRRNGCDQDRSGELDVDIGKEKTVGNALPKFLLQSLGPLAMALGRDASVNFRIETLQIAHEVHIDRNRVLPVLEQKHELLDDVASRSHPRLIPAFLPVVKVLDTSPDQRLAVAEQLVDRPFGNAQPGCDVVHANRLDPVAYEQIGRFRYDPIF